jgi:hypothetical protein
MSYKGMGNNGKRFASGGRRIRVRKDCRVRALFVESPALDAIQSDVLVIYNLHLAVLST